MYSISFSFTGRTIRPGNSHYQHTVRDFHSWRNHGSGSDQAFLADDSVSQQHGADANQ